MMLLRTNSTAPGRHHGDSRQSAACPHNGKAAAIGMMPACGNFALMIEQRVQHVQRLARGSRDQLGIEGAIAVRKVSVCLEARLVTVVGVQIGGVTTIPGSLEELAVR